MISLTDAAVRRIQEMVRKREDAIGLRVGVIESGCSGYRYTLDYATAVADEDTVLEQDGVKVVIDQNSAPLLDGVELDFVRQGLNQSFKFNNPNAVSSCGCGESFSISK